MGRIVGFILVAMMMLGSSKPAANMPNLEETEAGIAQIAVPQGKKQGEKYGCKYCSRFFNRGDVLKNHVRVHTGEKPFGCKVEGCNKFFRTRDSLKVHERTHTREKRYSCGVCGKSFSHISSVKNHERTHTGERPYKCQICGKLFAHSSNRNTHQKKIHGIESQSKKAIAAAAESGEDQESDIEDLEALRNGLSVPAGQTIPSLGVANFEAAQAKAGIAFFGLTQEEIANVIKIDELGDIFGNGGSDEE